MFVHYAKPLIREVAAGHSLSGKCKQQPNNYPIVHSQDNGAQSIHSHQ